MSATNSSNFKVMNPKSRKGFTLIELMVTISIMAILFGVVVTAATAIRKNARDTQRQGDLAKIQSALQNYYGDQTTFPVVLPAAGSPLTAGSITYLNTIPSDPTPGNPPYCYIPYVSNGGVQCTATPCNYYQLYAQLENSTGNSYGAMCNQAGANYNYLVSSP